MRFQKKVKSSGRGKGAGKRIDSRKVGAYMRNRGSPISDSEIDNEIAAEIAARRAKLK